MKEVLLCRDEESRTPDPLLPKQVIYPECIKPLGSLNVTAKNIAKPLFCFRNLTNIVKTFYSKMQHISSLLRELRVEKGYPLRKVAAFLDIDQAILSKMERGLRNINKEQVVKLARFFDYDEKKMILVYLSDRVLYEVGDDVNALEALKVAERVLEYKAYSAIDRNQIIEIIVDVMGNFPQIIKAWIYGSFAREEDRPESDIDIAVKTDEGFSYFDLAGLQYRLEEELNRKIDIGFINSFKPRILENVKKELILIYERQKAG